MLRWCLSTVRPLGGHDTNSRWLRLSRPRFIRAHTDSAVRVPVADLVKAQDTLVVASAFAQSHLADVLSPWTCADSSEDRDACGAARTRTSHSAIDTLKHFLSSENVASDHPLIYSPTIIRSLYYRAESRNQLEMLNSRMLTLLICLFGSLSISPRVSIVYRHPLAFRFSGVSTRRTHWAFVLKVGRHKSEKRMPLQDSDRFWLMRAELAIVQARSPLGPLSRDAFSAILRARAHYHIIRRHSRRLEVHAHYLETLLAIPDPRLLDLVACDLSFLLRNHRMCHPQLQRLLYRLVIQHGGGLSTQSQEAILAALWSRACQGVNGSPDLELEDDLSHITCHDCVLDTTAIARSLSTTLFGFGHLSNDKSMKSLGHLFSVFSPAYSLHLRWSSLVFFSIFNSSEILHFNGTCLAGDHVMPQITSCWQVILGLATIEKVLPQEPSSEPAMQSTPTEGILETTRSLYQLWLPVVESRLVSQDLTCTITASFLRLASVLVDETLFYDCQDLYRAENGSGGPWTSMQKYLAAQYIAAAMRVQGPLPDVVLATLEGFSLDIKQQVLAFAVEALTPIDASLAYTLYTIAQEKEMGVDSGAAHGLAMSFARSGIFRQDIFFLNNGRFSLEKRGILISAIARSLRENPRIRHPPSVFVGIVDELAALYHSHVPPQHFRGHLEQLFIVLAQHGRGSQLFPVVLSIFKRQFSTASKLLDSITAVHTPSLRILRDRIVMRARTFRMFKRIIPHRSPMSLRLSSRLRGCPSARPPLELSLQGLLKSGRVLAAKRIFACAAATTSSRQCTVLGNVVLHGVSRQSTSRNGRRVRRVLALLENLVKNHGFRPDRVTVNILVKAMIHWRSAFESPRLRELFDQIVRGGYPAADYTPLRAPFDTRRTHFLGSSGFSKLPPFISFEKHARPLFKMFIKAFYSCNDVEAARKVVWILKVEEYKHAVAKEARQRARSKGRVEAGQRNAAPLDVTVS